MKRRQSPIMITPAEARALWMQAQGLTQPESFGKGTQAVEKAIRQLGYVQIDTIHVIERCHHHILFTRIPTYRVEDLTICQRDRKSVFEAWTHALSYVAIEDYPYFISKMKERRKDPGAWFAGMTPAEVKKWIQWIKKNGPVTVRDLPHEPLREKRHLWESKKPSKKALEYGFFIGDLVIAERHGMVKRYDTIQHHLGWKKIPQAASEQEVNQYLLARAIRSQVVVSLDSICYLEPKRKKAVQAVIDQEVHRGRMKQIHLQDRNHATHWMLTEPWEQRREWPVINSEQIHILSPFDPLMIQRKRTELFFNYRHVFEAYLPASKRQFGYFALPILMGDRIVSMIDLKTDRKAKKLLIQKWTWLKGERYNRAKSLIESELDRFEKFQLRNGSE